MSDKQARLIDRDKLLKDLREDSSLMKYKDIISAIETGRYDIPSNQGEVARIRESLQYASEMLSLIAYGNTDINEIRQTARETVKEVDRTLSSHTEE